MIGGILGGPEVAQSKIWRIATIAKNSVRDSMPVDSNSFRLQLVLCIPGSISRTPGFEGIRTSSSSKKLKHASIQAAVPAELVESDEANAWLLKTIRDAIVLCEAKCKRQKFPFDRKLHEAMAGAVAVALGLPTN